jgi:hypothetical protein
MIGSGRSETSYSFRYTHGLFSVSFSPLTSILEELFDHAMRGFCKIQRTIATSGPVTDGLTAAQVVMASIG